MKGKIVYLILWRENLVMEKGSAKIAIIVLIILILMKMARDG